MINDTGVPPTMWEVFDICDRCGTDKGKTCYNLIKSTSRNLIPVEYPHPGRKMIKADNSAK